MNGIDLLRAVNQLYPDLPVAIFYTNCIQDSELTNEELFALGAIAVLRKPIQLEEINHVLAQFIK